MRALDHRGDLFAIGDVGAVGQRGSARALDLFDDLKGRLRRSAVFSEIVHDDLGAARGEAKRMTSAEPAARAGDDRNPAVEA